MKRFRFFFALTVSCLFLFIFAAPARSAERSVVPVPVKDNKGREVLLYKESHALVIGVSEYTGGWPRLPGVADDVREVKKALESAGFSVTAVMDPDRDKLDKAFADFINEHGQARDNRLLLYFAGHGHTAKLEYGAEMGYIVPADAPDPNRDKAGFLRKAMDMQMVEVFARRIQSKHAVFMFDSCFSGSLFALTRAIPQVIQEKTALPVRQFITAGTANQEVPDESLFRRMFVQALQGDGDLNKDGYVTVTELGQYLEDTVTNYSKRSQTPKYGKIRDPILDRGDFVFPLKITPGAEKAPQELARLEPREEPKPGGGVRPQTGGGCPERMASIPGGRLASENISGGMSTGGFCMDKYEATQAEYEKVMGSNPSYFKGANLPAEGMTWHEADAYCRVVGKRLPTEWEWEYAARAGTTTAYYWGDKMDGDYAWYVDNSGGKTHPAGQKKPNAWGLYDMSGNVMEWTASDYDSSREKTPAHFKGYKMLRGGSWPERADSLRSASRNQGGGAGSNVGFRCVKDVGEKNSLAEEREQLALLEPPKPAEKPQAPAPPGMARIPGGAFYAGLQGEKDNPARELDIGTFKMDKYEVTQADYERIMGNNPSYFKNCPNCPVEQVTWHEADAYCKKAGKRLPTEWEWEKAARAGTTTAYYWGGGPDGAYAWWRENSDEKTHPAGEKKPNGYGLYDMAGNVWEWTASDYEGKAGAKVVRGGAWSYNPISARPAYRLPYDPDKRFDSIGFRCAR